MPIAEKNDLQQTGEFQFLDGVMLFTRSWQPAEKIRAVVVIVHGYGEHSGRYQHIAEKLNGIGAAVEMFDLRGHGYSGGKRVYITRFEQYLRDLDDFLHRVADKYPHQPLFLMGHSMGGLIAVKYFLDFRPEVRGLLLSSAALKINDDIAPFLQKIAGVISALLPTLPTVKLNEQHISRDPAVVQARANDSLVYKGGTPARLGAEVIRITREIQDSMAEIDCPLLIFHGSADQITDPQGSRQLHVRSASADKTLKVYEGLYHETMNEPEKMLVLQDILDWLNARI